MTTDNRPLARERGAAFTTISTSPTQLRQAVHRAPLGNTAEQAAQQVFESFG